MEIIPRIILPIYIYEFAMSANVVIAIVICIILLLIFGRAALVLVGLAAAAFYLTQNERKIGGDDRSVPIIKVDVLTDDEFMVPKELGVGRIIKITDTLGTGAFGTVSRFTSDGKPMDRFVIKKLLHQNASQIDKISAELQLQHDLWKISPTSAPEIKLFILDLGQDQYAVIMEKLQSTLADEVDKLYSSVYPIAAKKYDEVVTIDELARVKSEVLEAWNLANKKVLTLYKQSTLELLEMLKTIASRTVFIHGDLKIDNVMYDENYKLRLIDFGASKFNVNPYGIPDEKFPKLLPEMQALAFAGAVIFGVVAERSRSMQGLYKIEDIAAQKWELKINELQKEAAQLLQKRRETADVEEKKRLLDQRNVKMAESQKIKDIITNFRSVMNPGDEVLDFKPIVEILCPGFYNKYVDAFNQKRNMITYANGKLSSETELLRRAVSSQALAVDFSKVVYM